MALRLTRPSGILDSLPMSGRGRRSEGGGGMEIGSRDGAPKLGRARSRLLPRPTLDPEDFSTGPFFATAAVPCPYIPGKAERKMIVELTGRAAPAFYDDLSRAGFRRSHRFAYRP